MRKEFKISIYIILFATVLSGALIVNRVYFYHQNYRIEKSQDYPDLPPLPQPPTLSEVCTPAAQEIIWKTKSIKLASDQADKDKVVDAIYETIDATSKIHLSKSAQSGLWWITKDNWNIIAPGAAGFSIAFPVTSYCPRSAIIRYPIFHDLNATISDILLRNGFVRNKLNSSKSEDDETFYDYVLGFEKGNTRCTLETNSEISSGGTRENIEWANARFDFTCSDQLDKYYAEQIPFLKGLDDRHAVIGIEKILGSFAKIQYHYRRGGLYAIMIKSEGTWIPIVKSQEAPLCSIVLKYHIPVQIYGSPGNKYTPSAACYDESGRMLASPGGPRLGE